MFGENEDGAFVSVSQEKIRQIAQQASSSSEREHSRYGERWRGPLNLFEQRPTFSNNHGKLYEADSSDYPALRPTSSNKHVNVSVSFATIRGVSYLLFLFLFYLLKQAWFSSFFGSQNGINFAGINVCTLLQLQGN